MDASSLVSQGTVEDYHLALETALLEKEYEATLGHTAQILDAEKCRAKDVEQLLLQFENEALRWQLDRTDRELAKIIKTENTSRTMLDGALQELGELRNQYRISSQEMERLRNELATMNNTTAGAKELLAEINRLSKELADSRSEVERLATQTTSSSATIAEKHALERQLNTLEVQIEDEKRAHERTLAKFAKQAEERNALNSSLEEARRKLAKEIEARNHQERVARQQSSEWASQRAELEAKLEMLSKKSHSQDHTPAVQNDSHRQHENITNESGNTVRSRVTAIEQSTSRLDPELTIATPGAVRAQNKKTKVSALPGDKSAFSITPFLNRKKELRNSLGSDNDSDELHSSTPIVNTANVPGRAKKDGNQEQDREGSVLERPFAESKQRLGQTSTEVKILKGGQRKQSAIASVNDRSDGSSLLSAPIAQGQAKSRKRKLGTQRDRSIFDEEEEDDDFRSMKKQGRKLTGTGRSTGVQSSALKAGHSSLSRGFSGFPEFSPLKRDKKRF
ncbi:hypothetical protein BDV59DRAFT_195537 [Aspergillus ambiguus]|uniref:uncharacterized protein n=1 Tax=Aspergillus ambiguus TaxID=176160 RepID=UPI003CCD2293